MDEENVFTTHLMKSLFTGTLEDGNSTDISPLLIATIKQGSQDPTCQLAVDAVAAAYFGKVHSSQQAMNKGAVLYTRVLRKIRDDISDPERIPELSTFDECILPCCL